MGVPKGRHLAQGHKKHVYLQAGDALITRSLAKPNVLARTAIESLYIKHGRNHYKKYIRVGRRHRIKL